MTTWFDIASGWTAVTDTPVAAVMLAVISVVLVVLVARVARDAIEIRRATAMLGADLVDDDTGLLPPAALEVLVDCDLRWARTIDAPLAVLVVRVRGIGMNDAAARLRAAMREEEHAFRIGEQDIVVELWNADEDAARRAAVRLMAAMSEIGYEPLDIGIAVAPSDADQISELVAVARARRGPADDIAPVFAAVDTSWRGAVTRGIRALGAVLGPVSLVAAFAVLVDGAASSVVEAAADERGMLVLAGAVAAWLVLGGVVALCWNVDQRVVLAGRRESWTVGRGWPPRSRPLATAGVATVGSITIAGGLGSWVAIAAERTDVQLVAVAATASCLLVLVLAMGRSMVHVPVWLVVLVGAVGAAVLLGGFELGWPLLVLNGGRVLVALAAGSLVARLVEFRSWLVGLVVAIAAIDLWSVFHEHGVTRRLIEGDGDTSRQVVDILLATGPSIDGSPVAYIGLTDLVFVTVLVCWTQLWRGDVRVITALTAAAMGGTIVAAFVLDAALPALPAIAAAALGAVAWDHVAVRRRRST